MTCCIVHDTDYDMPAFEKHPTLDDLEQELTDHLGVLLGDETYKESHSAEPCGYCYEEMRIREDDIEGLLLEEDHMNRWIDQECTCPADSPNRLLFWETIRRENHEVSA